MGGSGLIVVVIVAAWALFLVPQWLHRRASAAAHLADRVPEAGGDTEADADDSPSGGRRFGRRQLARSRRDSPRRSRWHLRAPRRLRSVLRHGPPGSPDPVGTHVSRPDVPSKETAVHPSGPRSAAARRRRVVVGLASLTLLAALVVALGAATSVPVPAWIVAVPGALLVAYLVLLAVLRPGARTGAGYVGVVEVEPLPSIDDDEHELATSEGGDLVRAGAASGTHHSVAEGMQTALHASGDQASPSDVDAPSVWTPVPLPAPTYVTAPRARRAVRTIDLSNPGSWTAAPLTDAAEAEAASSAGGVAEAEVPSSAGFLRSTPSDGTSAPANSAEAADADEGADYLEHRRAVGD